MNTSVKEISSIHSNKTDHMKQDSSPNAMSYMLLQLDTSINDSDTVLLI